MTNLVRHLRHATLVVLTCAAATAWTADAHAQGPVDAEAAGEQASKLYRQGNAAFEQKKWAEAETAYLQAWKIAHTFDVAANLGEVALHLGRPREAARHLAFSLRSAPPSAKQAQRDRTRHFLEEAKQQIGTLRLRPSLPDAHASIDGAPVDRDELPYELFVDPGPHTIAVQHDGYQPTQTTITASAGSTQEIPLALVPFAPERRSIVPGVVLGSVGGAAVVAGSVLLGLAAAKRSQVGSLATESNHTCVVHNSAPQGICAQLASAVTQYSTLGDAGLGALVVGGAAAVAATTYMLWPTPRPGAGAERAIRVVPVVRADGATIFFTGTF